MQTDDILGKRILLVEDERAVRETFRLLLAKDQHIVVEANNGAEAFALFLREKFDLVITDYEIPFLKGNELAAKIKRAAPSQPVLMVTAFDQRPGLQNPVDIVLNKPFNTARFLSSVANLLSEAGQKAPDSASASEVPANPAFETEVVCN
jgi:DNA-binding response OmpR family regulator